MTRYELLKALNRLKVETGSLACIGCGHEHNCSLHGCAIIREAYDKVFNLTTWRPGAVPPKTDNRVLCLTHAKNGTFNIVIGYYMNGMWRCGMNSNVLGWMPLPDAPEGGKENA